MNKDADIKPNEKPIRFFEIKREVNGVPVILKFPEPINNQAVTHVQEMMLKSFSRKMFISSGKILN